MAARDPDTLTPRERRANVILSDEVASQRPRAKNLGGVINERT
jgi:hypothetical protein